jgi:hypothetical protein
MPDESAIELYLTISGDVFIAPQYNIAFKKKYGDGGACPDFVALDLKRKHVVIVEVSSAMNLNGLFERVRKRSTRWYDPVRRKLQNDLRIIDEKWKERFLGFVRSERVSYAKSKFSNDSDVQFFAIEKASIPWAYWDDRIKDGLP